MGATRVIPETGERTGGEYDILASPRESHASVPTGSLYAGRHFLVHRVLLSIGVGERHRLNHITQVW